MAGRKQSVQDRNRRLLRSKLWPGLRSWIWDLRDDEVKGFATLPRLLPLVCHLLKVLSSGNAANATGDPSPVYYDLWCRDFGQAIVTVRDEQECAYASGYNSTRAVRTWRAHMLQLVELGFILAKQDGLREYAHVLLLDPLAVCARLHEEKKVPKNGGQLLPLGAHADKGEDSTAFGHDS